ncbi:MAG: SIMPL domain-containing protein [Pseudomonadota bacterium]
MNRFLASGMIFGAVALFSMSLGTTHSVAQANEPTPRIMVSGTGTADVAPDMAVLTLSVLRQEETARAALDANNIAMQRVLAAMAEEGIEPRDMQTSNFNIRPRFERPKSNSGTRRDPEIIGYDVSNTLTVRVRNLSTLGRVLDRSVSLGVNSGGNVRFSNQDPSEAIEQARINAMKAAVRKAELLTSTAGVGLGAILEISERSKSGVQSIAHMSTTRTNASAVPIATGENNYSVTVNISYALEQ